MEGLSSGGQTIGSDCPRRIIIFVLCFLLGRGFGVPFSTITYVFYASASIIVIVSFPRLTLEWNNLGVWEESFTVFCEGLGANHHLQMLDLRNNQINHQGAGELAMALKANSSLQELGKAGLLKNRG